MDDETAVHFRDELRRGRETALRNAESFEGIVFALERLGSFLTGRIQSLGQYEGAVSKVAASSPLAAELPCKFPNFHIPFQDLYSLVRNGRNSALHQGAFARHLTRNAVQLALILEDALMNDKNNVGHYMVRNPVVAQMWQPLSFIRQMMLANSFSYLPVPIRNGNQTEWQLVRDLELARYLRGVPGKERDRRLSKTLQEAAESNNIALCQTKISRWGDSIEDALEGPDGHPTLIVSEENGDLLGILTPFDLL